MVHLGTTPSGFDVELGRSVVDSDLTIYLNCSTMRGFSGGWKSVCVGLSGYRSIHHHHTPDIMSMSLDRNRMHEILNEMGALTESVLGPERIFKVETVLANPLEVHDMYGGSVLATREAVTSKLRLHQRPRREMVEEPVDIVVYGVPDWSPYAAYSHTNPILDIISTGLGYLGGVIEAVGKPGCTVVLATPCPPRWNMTHHPAYKEVWETVLTETLDPEKARHVYEPGLARRADYIEKYRFANALPPGPRNDGPLSAEAHAPRRPGDRGRSRRPLRAGAPRLRLGSDGGGGDIDGESRTGAGLNSRSHRLPPSLQPPVTGFYVKITALCATLVHKNLEERR